MSIDTTLKELGNPTHSMSCDCKGNPIVEHPLEWLLMGIAGSLLGTVAIEVFKGGRQQ